MYSLRCCIKFIIFTNVFKRYMMTITHDSQWRRHPDDAVTSHWCRHYTVKVAHVVEMLTAPHTALPPTVVSKFLYNNNNKKKIYNAHRVKHYRGKHKSETQAVARWPDGVCYLLISWVMRWDLRWRLKLYREEQFLMKVGIKFHVAGEL